MVGGCLNWGEREGEGKECGGVNWGNGRDGGGWEVVWGERERDGEGGRSCFEGEGRRVIQGDGGRDVVY